MTKENKTVEAIKEPTLQEQWKMKKLMRKFENIKLRNYLRGELIWDSAEKGTYYGGAKHRNPKKEKLNKGRKGYGDCVGSKPPSGKKFYNLVNFFVKRDLIRETHMVKKNENG